MKNIEKLKSLVDEAKRVNYKNLEKEYNSLIESLENVKINEKYKNHLSDFTKIANQSDADDKMPGNIRKADHFLAFVRRVVMYIKEELSNNELKIVHPTNFMYNLMYEQH